MTDFSFEPQVKKETKPPFMVIYGPSGVGKTTLPSYADGVVYLPTEDGAGELELLTLKDGVFNSVEEFIAAVRYVYKNCEEMGMQTVIVDSLDHLEPLVWKHVCEENSWDSIETPGYGRGYVECDKQWRRIIDALMRLRDDKNITVVCIAHDIVRIVNDPQNGPYDAHELKLHKRAVALWKEKSDLIGLLKNQVVVDQKTGKGKGGTTPTLFVRPNAAYTAKTRYTKMPGQMPIGINDGWTKLIQHIPYFNKNTQDEEK